MRNISLKSIFIVMACFIFQASHAQIEREFEIKVTDDGLYFDGERRISDYNINNAGFEYRFGRRITPHGDCIKKFGDFLFLTWYLGGEENKNVMLSRLHIPTQTLETVKFTHTHVGYQHKYPHIGDSHNTIAVAVCPLDSTVHLLYDMHSYSQVSYPETFFNYQVSLKGAANAPVGSFTIDLFNPRQTYLNSSYNYSDITYPNFFLNTEDELFVWFREGGNNNGKYKFAKYDGNEWGPFTNFSTLNARSKGNAYNWGLYGDMKYINGKLRVGFLKRMSYNDDKYVYNNGFHYAYTNDPEGETQWYNYKDEPFSLPLINPEKIFFYEPGDEVTQGGANSVYIASGTDFTVTDEEAVHFITNNVRSKVDGTIKDVHAYKKPGDTEFTISTDFPGGNLYAVDGNQVFLISQNNNRPEIFRALGGTNDWEKIHTETTGISMEHSNVLIADGKLFVYAMQKASGDARPIYIQMYDLDIAPIDTSRYIEFENLANGQEIEKGTNLTVEANVGSAYSEVSLWYGDTNLGTLTSAPYSWTGHDVLTNMENPEYTFKLVAKDSDNNEEETSITLSVVSDGVPIVDVDSMIEKLMFYCPLEEDGSDLSGNNNNATPGNAVTFEAGKMGNAASLSYTEGSYITSADSVYKYSYPTAYTIAFWLKVEEYGERRDILQPAGGRTLLYSDGELNFRTFHQKKLAVFSITEEEKDEWFHVAMVIDQREGQTQHKFYVNGEQRGDAPSGYDLETDKPQSIGRLIFGSSSDEALQRNLNGMIDEIYMFDEILSDDEIVYLMNTNNLMDSGTPPEPDPLASINVNFEDESKAENWLLEANYAESDIVDYDGSRTGSKAFKVTNFERNTGFHFTNNAENHIEAKPGEYVHSIVHAVSTEDGGLIAPSFSSEWVSVTPGFSSLDTLEMKRFTFSRQYPDTESDNMNVYPRVRMKPGVTTNEIYVDDMVLYAHASNVTDIVAPRPASDFSSYSNTASSILLSWTEGADTLTGVQGTYVLRTTMPLTDGEPVQPEAPVLLPQVKYSHSGGSEGPNTVGDWTLVALLEAGTTSYTDESIADGVTYRYAIVHRDLAFNNSDAVLDFEAQVAPTILSDVSTSVEKGDDISATSNKDGMVYLVPDADYAELDAVIAAKVAEVSVTENVAASIPTSTLDLGDYLVYAVDADDNLSDPSSVVIIKTVVPPVLSDVSTSVEKGDDISVTSDKDGMIYLVPDAEYAGLDAVITAKVAEVAVNENVAAAISTSSLDLGDYLVYAVDADDNLSDPSDVVTVKDETAPSVPSVTVDEGAISGTSIVISFTEASDNDAVSEYKIYLGDNVLTSLDAVPENYTYEGLQVGTEYTLGVTAIDNSGNESDMGSATATTLLPVITGFEFIDATTDQKISDITNNMVIYVTNESNNLNIRTVTDPEPLFDGLKVKMDISGDMSHSKTEGGAPYAVWGDVSGDYNDNELDTGSYSLQAVIINDNEEEVIDPVSLDFKVVDSTLNVSSKSFANSIVNVYPVPVNHTLYVSGFETGEAVVFNSSGKMVARYTEIKDGLNVSFLENGLYLLKLSDKKGVVNTARFIKR